MLGFSLIRHTSLEPCLFMTWVSREEFDTMLYVPPKGFHCIFPLNQLSRSQEALKFEIRYFSFAKNVHIFIFTKSRLFGHFWEMRSHSQTGNTTAKFHISLQRGRIPGQFLHWNFDSNFFFKIRTWPPKILWWRWKGCCQQSFNVMFCHKLRSIEFDGKFYWAN